MTIFGILVVLVEFLGIGLYYHLNNYLGIVWCIFWIIGIIYYEVFYIKRFYHDTDQLKRLMGKHSVCASDNIGNAKHNGNAPNKKNIHN